MLIIADENMPYAAEWFGCFGTVRTVPGRAITAASLRDAEALLVRSVTRVDRNLLQGTAIKFIGSATSGVEHIDSEYLHSQHIAHASAPGCNATAVVEYVLSCICALDGVLEKLLSGGVVGVLGLGNVGARLIRRLQVLNIDCIGYDPFLDAESDLPLSDLDSVIDADIVCCHTPLTQRSPYPTQHLFDAQRLRQLRHNAVLINAARGAVVDNAALLSLLRERDDLRVVLDVWEGEPRIDLSLMDRIALATPHIAGYSWDGKVAGTRTVLEAFCDFFNLPVPENIGPESAPSINLSPQPDTASLLRAAIQSIYDVRRDDREMRSVLHNGSRDEIAANFDRLRKNYPQRREIAAHTIENWSGFDADDRALLQRLGFRKFQ